MIDAFNSSLKSIRSFINQEINSDRKTSCVNMVKNRSLIFYCFREFILDNKFQDIRRDDKESEIVNKIDPADPNF